MSVAKRFIYIDCLDKLQVDEDGLKLINNIPEDYGIATIYGVGPGRIGKSSLMNYLHGNTRIRDSFSTTDMSIFPFEQYLYLMKGVPTDLPTEQITIRHQANVFEIGSTSARVTKGIWVAIVLDVTKKLATVYFDVEGFGDPKRATVSNTNLLLVVCQHCDVLLYNIRGVFDYKMMENMNMVGYFFERYRKENQLLPRPALAVVLRDFDLDIPDSPDKELQDLFKQSSEGVNLDRSFRSIKTFILAKPTVRKNLSSLDSMTDLQLDPDFVTIRNQLQAYIRNEAKPLCTHTKNLIKGKVFVKAIRETVDAVNNDNLGILTKTLPDLLKEENERLMDIAISDYKHHMLSYWPVTSAPETIHNQLKTATKEKLQEKLFDIDGCTQSLLHQFEVQLDQCFRDLSEKKSKEELVKQSVTVERNYRNNSYFVIGGYHNFESDMRVVEIKYKGLNNLGPKATDVWKIYNEDQQSKRQMIIAREISMNERLAAERLRIQAEKEIRQANAKIEERRQQYDLMVHTARMERRNRNVRIAKAVFDGIGVVFGIVSAILHVR